MIVDQEKFRNRKKMSKKMLQKCERIDRNRRYTVSEGLTLLKELSDLNFVETVEASIRLGIDSRRSDQIIRGSVVLPKGRGKEVRVAAFAHGVEAQKAQESGADLIIDLISDIKNNKLDFDVLVTTPENVKEISQVGNILGPKGLMPNSKDGTITSDIAGVIKSIKNGQVKFRNDKSGIIHCAIGKISFTVHDLEDNLKSLLIKLRSLKPSKSKGVYFKKIVLSTTMGPGVVVDMLKI